MLAEFERIDVLVNNAGIGQRSAAKDTLLDVDRRVMEVDFFGPVALTKLVLPRMVEQRGGHLVVTSSVAGKHAVPHHSAYCAAKHALHGYFDTLRIEHLDDQYRCDAAGHRWHQEQCFSACTDGRWVRVRHRAIGMNPRAFRLLTCAERVVEAMLNREHEVVIGIEPALAGDAT